MAKSNHVHKYKKVNIGNNGKEYLVYRCVKPLCNHYIPMHMAEGRLCECNRCGGTMLITKQTLIHSHGTPMAKPHCVDCVKRKKVTNVADVAAFLDKAGLKD